MKTKAQDKFFHGCFARLIADFHPEGEKWLIEELSADPQKEFTAKYLIFKKSIAENLLQIYVKASSGTWRDELVTCYDKIWNEPKNSLEWACASLAVKLMMGIYDCEKINDKLIADFLKTDEIKALKKIYWRNNFWNSIYLPFSEVCDSPAFYFDDKYKYSLETNRTRFISPLLNKFIFSGAHRKNQYVVGILCKAVIEDYSKQYFVAYRLYFGNDLNIPQDRQETLGSVFSFVFEECIKESKLSPLEKELLVQKSREIVSRSQNLSHLGDELSENEMDEFLQDFSKVTNCVLNQMNCWIGVSKVVENKTNEKIRINFAPIVNPELTEDFIREYDEKRMDILADKSNEQVLKEKMKQHLKVTNQVNFFLKNFCYPLDNNITVLPYMARAIIDSILSKWAEDNSKNKKIVEGGRASKLLAILDVIIESDNSKFFMDLCLWLKKWTSPVIDKLNDYAHFPRGIGKNQSKDLLIFALRFSFLSGFYHGIVS